MPGKKKSKSASRMSGAKKHAKKAQAPASKKANAISAPAAVLDSEKLKELYSTMLKCRMLSEKARGLAAIAGFDATKMVIPGHEAVLVGAAAHAFPEDWILPTTNGLLTEFIKGTPTDTLLKRFLEEYAHAVLITDKTSIAERAVAMSELKMNNFGTGKRIMLTFSPEEKITASSQYDTLALAARNKLPLVCLTEITLSKLSSVENQHSSENMDSYFPRIAVDGTDVVAVFRVTQEAVRRARGGHGPSLIQCVMPDESSARGKAQDPLAFMERYLRRKKLWSSDRQRKIADDFRRELDLSFKAAQAQIRTGSVAGSSSH